MLETTKHPGKSRLVPSINAYNLQIGRINKHKAGKNGKKPLQVQGVHPRSGAYYNKPNSLGIPGEPSEIQP